ncbi:MAG: hypothetical protein R2688_10645 [Fimbriimonadaceae bacterium]
MLDPTMTEAPTRVSEVIKRQIGLTKVIASFAKLVYKLKCDAKVSLREIRFNPDVIRRERKHFPCFDSLCFDLVERKSAFASVTRLTI